MHVRSKQSLELDDQIPLELPAIQATQPSESHLLTPVHSTLSLPLTREIAAVREELALVVVVTIIFGYVMDAALDEVLPSVINRSLDGPLTPLNENTGRT